MIVEPLDGLLDLVHDGLLVRLDLSGELLVVEAVLERVAVVLQAVLRLDACRVLLVLVAELFGLLNQLDLLLGKAALVVGDGDLVLLARLFDGVDIEDAVGINVVGHLDLRYAARHGGDAVEVELSEKVVVARHGALALVHLDEDRLVVRVGEGLRLLRRHGRALDQSRHHASSRLNAQTEGSIKEKQVIELDDWTPERMAA